MPAHPSHSSNLSPLAPPFTVVSSQPRWSPFSGASFIPRPSQSAAGGEALYPEPEGYGVGQWDWSSPIGGAEGNGGRGAGSSWLEPSYKAEGYCADGLPPLENSSGVWHENHLGSFAGKVHLGSAECSESLYQRHPSVYEADVGPPKISRDLVLARHPSAYEADVGPPKISRDLALAHCSSTKRNFYPLAESSINFNSCDTFMGYTANSCANIAQVHEPSSRITTSFADFRMLQQNGYSEDQLANPYKTDTHFKDQNSSNLKDLSGSQFAGVKEFYDEILGKSNMKVHTSMPVYSFSSKTSLPSRSDFTNEILENTSSEVETVEAGIKLKPLILPSASIYGSGLAEPSTSNGTSSQALDQINCYVDSPCWKRPPTYLTSVGLNASVRELTKADDFYQDQKHLPLSIDNSETLPSQQVGAPICNEIVKASLDFSLSESPVILPSLPNNLDDAGKLRSDCLKNNNGEMNYNSDACMDQNRNSEGSGIKAPLDKDEILVSTIHPLKEGTFANNVTDLKTETQGSPSVNSCGKQFSGNHVELLVKSISSLSEVLLSLFIGGTNELKDQDHDLLELALRNLELVTSQGKKVVASGSIIPSEQNAAGLRDMNLVPDGLNMTNNVTNHGVNRKVNSSSNNVSVDGVKKSSMTCMAQAFEKAFEGTIPEQEENPQALIYKNLWIEAEAALCSMKYEVQRSRMKMETENLKHLVKGSSSQTPSSSLRNSDGGGLQKAEEQSPGNMTPYQSGARGGLQKAEERLPGNSTPHRSGTEDNCDTNSIKSCQDTTDKSEVLDASVLATLSFLESPTGYSDSTVRDQPRACVGTKEMIMSEYFPRKYSDTTVKELVPHTNTVNYSQYIGKGYDRYCSTSSEVFDGYDSGGAAMAYPAFRRRNPPIGFAGPSSEWEHVLKDDLTL